MTMNKYNVVYLNNKLGHAYINADKINISGANVRFTIGAELVACVPLHSVASIYRVNK